MQVSDTVESRPSRSMRIHSPRYGSTNAEISYFRVRSLSYHGYPVKPRVPRIYFYVLCLLPRNMPFRFIDLFLGGGGGVVAWRQYSCVTSVSPRFACDCCSSRSGETDASQSPGEQMSSRVATTLFARVMDTAASW